MNKPIHPLLSLFRQHHGMETLLYMAQPFRLQRLNQILRGEHATTEEIQTLLTFLNKEAHTHYTLEDMYPNRVNATHPPTDIIWLENQIERISSSTKHIQPRSRDTLPLEQKPLPMKGHKRRKV